MRKQRRREMRGSVRMYNGGDWAESRRSTRQLIGHRSALECSVRDTMEYWTGVSSAPAY